MQVRTNELEPAAWVAKGNPTKYSSREGYSYVIRRRAILSKAVSSHIKWILENFHSFHRPALGNRSAPGGLVKAFQRHVESSVSTSLSLRFPVTTTASCLAHWLLWLARWLSLIGLALTCQNSVPTFATLMKRAYKRAWWESFMGCLTFQAYLLKRMAYPQRSLPIESEAKKSQKQNLLKNHTLSENDILSYILSSQCQRFAPSKKQSH